MKITFFKFHGNGNDFILVDGMTNPVKLTTEQIRQMCHRRFGIGADGLMEIFPDTHHAFAMKYYNSDGLEGTMCGNGGRCIAAFAFWQGYDGNKFSFQAIDGVHQAVIESVIQPEKQWFVSLQMQDVKDIEQVESDFYINTGSPHLIKFVDDVHAIDVFTLGRKIRQTTCLESGGVNVNFVQRTPYGLFVRTYERGVEDETMSCGTGVTASAIAAGILNNKNNWDIETRGGRFKVDFINELSTRTQVWLRGPANLTFSGEIEL